MRVLVVTNVSEIPNPITIQNLRRKPRSVVLCHNALMAVPEQRAGCISHSLLAGSKLLVLHSEVLVR